jgi:hypothetical protein
MAWETLLTILCQCQCQASLQTRLSRLRNSLLCPKPRCSPPSLSRPDRSSPRCRLDLPAFQPEQIRTASTLVSSPPPPPPPPARPAALYQPRKSRAKQSQAASRRRRPPGQYSVARCQLGHNIPTRIVVYIIATIVHCFSYDRSKVLF